MLLEDPLRSSGASVVNPSLTFPLSSSLVTTTRIRVCILLFAHAGAIHLAVSITYKRGVRVLDRPIFLYLYHG